MKAYFIFLILIILFYFPAAGQNTFTDSLKKELIRASSDTQKIALLRRLGKAYNFSNADTSFIYTSEALRLAENLDDPFLISKMQTQMCATLAIKGNFLLALNYGLTALKYFEQSNDSINMAYCLGTLQLLYKEMGDYDRVIKNERESGDFRDRILKSSSRDAVYVYAYDKANLPDSVLFYAKKLSFSALNSSGLTVLLANAYNRKNIFDSALFYYRKSVDLASDNYIDKDIIDSYIGLAELYQKSGEYDSVKYYLLASVNEKNIESYAIGKLKTYEMLSKMYDKQRNMDSALFYLKKSNLIREELFSREKQNSINNLFFARDLQLKEVEKAKKEYNNRLKQNLLLSGLLILVITAGLLIRNVRQKQRSLVLIGKEKKEVEIQKSIAEATLEKLVTTQNQLVQSEKLASLGQLTAGIAHEIQNPLNFVKNFSEINVDLIADMKNEIEKGDLKEIKNIASDIEENEMKIMHHGQRADAIVKSMLLHSRSSAGQYELTDLSALCDEYLRLAYQSMKSKDKSFNATLHTNFDQSISLIKIIPQDIGRVLLNLFNNAFYAVSEKSKLHTDGFEPTITVSTKKNGDRTEISVADNGTGIPEKIKAKIFQPFFTTKPTGQGTGLGLSLSYDIIKAHGGEMKVVSHETEGATFVISLPV